MQNEIHLDNVYVYVSSYPFKTDNDLILPKIRADEINQIKNIEVKNQKFFVWKLLEYALNDALKLDIKDMCFEKQNTKWIAKECEFSLTHSQNIVAVAVCKKSEMFDNSVGIDVEKVDPNRFCDKLSERILSDEEKLSYNAINEQNRGLELNLLWTKKEAAFKKGNASFFNPQQICLEGKFYSVRIKNKENEFFLSTNYNGKRQIVLHLVNGVSLANN